MVGAPFSSLVNGKSDDCLRPKLSRSEWICRRLKAAVDSPAARCRGDLQGYQRVMLTAPKDLGSARLKPYA